LHKGGEQMKALVYTGPKQLEIQELPKPQPKKDEVLLKIRACGICGSDVHGYLGVTGRRTPPMIMGHEFCGEVVELGSDTKTIKMGDRVAVYPVDYCGHCKMCKQGDVHLCLNKRAFGVLDVDGAFAEYITVPEKCCFSIAADISDAAASLMEPLAVAYRGVSHYGSLENKTVLLVGTGTIGLLALACVKMKKASKIIVSDLHDGRLEIAKKIGADVVINPGKENFNERIMAETNGEGVDVSIEAVGIEITVKQALDALKLSGEAIWIGNNSPVITINMQQVVTKELKIQGSFLYGLDEFKQVVALINEKKVSVDALISAEISLDETPEYFEKLAHSPGNMVKVIMTDRK